MELKSVTWVRNFWAMLFGYKNKEYTLKVRFYASADEIKDITKLDLETVLRIFGGEKNE